ncbi:hypothetical protein L3Q82_025517 [Scortum barcoo]|uniref:Uncharacterized protein n=1 Tax=Scortum barcoo TaxID=214431 RepID=A0ACB8WKY5_9TELE|nr:hypothetical protein L3Q82_025517 [Scortum barcoo]
MDSRILCSFYRCTIESILTGCITAWYSSCTALNRKALQRVVKAAQHITRTELLSMEDLCHHYGSVKSKHYIDKDKRSITFMLLRDSSHNTRTRFILINNYHCRFAFEDIRR